MKYGQCRKPCIRYQVAACIRFFAKTFKNVPAPFARLYKQAVRLHKEQVTEPNYFLPPAGHCKNFRGGADADQTTHDLRSHTIIIDGFSKTEWRVRSTPRHPYRHRARSHARHSYICDTRLRFRRFSDSQHVDRQLIR